MKKKEEEKVNEKFETFKNYEYTEKDKEKVFNNEETITKKSQKGALAKYAEYIPLFFSMLKDTFSGDYKEIPKGSIAAIICTLIYVLSPVDLIPDFIPVLGLVDDALMIALCIKFVSSDIEKYKEFLGNKAKIDNIFKEE
jgi:uncharacterized membrane protein YkvA (DUF1232 family)